MFPMLCVDVAQNVFHQKRDVVLVLAQRRQIDMKHIQPEIQVLSQLPAGHRFLRILVCCRKHAHIHRRLAFASQPPYFAVFQNAQKFRLRRRGHLSDFVQEQGASIGKFEAADAPLGRAGERASLVAENLAFHQRFGNGGAVDRHKRPVRSR